MEKKRGDALLLLVNLGTVICNVGILLYKPWGRKIHLILVWAFTLLNIHFWYFMRKGTMMWTSATGLEPPMLTVPDVAIFIAIVACITSTIYLTRPELKEQFE